jgi:ribosomal protein S6--L-glutamate ligase
MKIFVLWERRHPPAPSPLMVDAVRRLNLRGHQVELARCDQLAVPVDRLVPAHDLYVLKSHTPFALSLAAGLHAQGARWLNPYPACALTADKARTARLLAAGGIPVPRTWAVGDLAGVQALVEQGALGHGPLIVKPARGLHGAGVRMIRRERDVVDACPLTEPAVVQQFIPGRGVDLKLYVAGDQVFATRKAFGPDSYARPGRSARIDGPTRALALQIGAVTGLGLYGLDVIESPHGPVVVDVNYFPGYRGHLDAGAAAAEYIHDFAVGHRTLDPPGAVQVQQPARLTGVDGNDWLADAEHQAATYAPGQQQIPASDPPTDAAPATAAVLSAG